MVTADLFNCSSVRVNDIDGAPWEGIRQHLISNGESTTLFPGVTIFMNVLEKTPTENSIALRRGDFQNLAEALDYAAEGETGINFYSGKGDLAVALPYGLLRSMARSLARKLLGLGLPRGGRMALVAETDADFVRFFFACQYAGLVPVPLPAVVHLGGRQAFVDNLRKLVHSSGAQAAMSSCSFLPFLTEAVSGLKLKHVGEPGLFNALPETDLPLQIPRPEDVAYLQYTSGSTRFPRGVVITQKTVMANLSGIIRHGLSVRPGDRCTSWLPFYHDMWLVGFLIAPMASQLSTDYLSTRDFAMRPRLLPSALRPSTKDSLSIELTAKRLLKTERLSRCKGMTSAGRLRNSSSVILPFPGTRLKLETRRAGHYQSGTAECCMYASPAS